MTQNDGDVSAAMWIESGGRAMDVAALAWHDHPVYKGVAMKHLLTAADTGGCFSFHLVRMLSRCTIGEHTHPEHWELHQVVSGNGLCRVGDAEMDYRAQVSAVMPRGVAHGVKAREDLLLLATFVPALL
jgi:quercetin dioxygenase-like cupin family protein